MKGKPLHFTLDGVEFAPFLEGTEDPTYEYFIRSRLRPSINGRHVQGAAVGLWGFVVGHLERAETGDGVQVDPVGFVGPAG